MIHNRMMRSRLRAYHDGSLHGMAQAAVARHLAVCADCLFELERLQSADCLLVRARPMAPALTQADAKELFTAALAASGVSSPRRFLFGGRLAGAAMLLMVGIGSHSMRLNMDAKVPQVAATRAMEQRENPPLPLVQASGHNLLFRPPPAQANRPNPTRKRTRNRQVSAQQPRSSPLRASHTRLADSARVPPEPRVSPAAYSEAPARQEQRPFLLVLVRRQTTALSVKVSQASVESPGFASAETTTINPTGGQIVTRATITTCTAPFDVPEGEPGAQLGPETGPDEPCDWEECNDVE